jgi:general stress protein YciG
MSIQSALIELAKEFLAAHPQLETEIETLAGQLGAVTENHVQAELGRKGGQAAHEQQQQPEQDTTLGPKGRDA